MFKILNTSMQLTEFHIIKELTYFLAEDFMVMKFCCIFTNKISCFFELDLKN